MISISKAHPKFIYISKAPPEISISKVSQIGMSRIPLMHQDIKVAAECSTFLLPKLNSQT